MKLARQIGAGAALVALALSSSARASEDTYNGWVRHDVRAFGALCDGTTDDRAAFNDAFSFLNSRGGGIVFVPAVGSLCVIDDNSGAGLAPKANVTLECEPGAGIKAASGAVFTNALVYTSLVDDWGISNCQFDMNSTSENAINASLGSGVQIANVRVYGWGTTGTGQTGIQINTSLSSSTRASFVRDSVVECAGDASDDDEVGISLTGGVFASRAVLAQNNRVVNCDKQGLVLGNGAVAVENKISMQDGGAVGLVLGQYTSASDNEVYGTGSAQVGILVNGAYATSTGNHVWLTGTGAAVGLSTESDYAKSANDDIRLSGNCTDCVGIVLGADTNVTNCVINMSVAATNNIAIRPDNLANTSQISDCRIYGGDFGITSGLQYTTTNGDNIPANIRISDNVLWSQQVASVVIPAAGWHLVGNTLNYLDNSTGAVLWVGMDADEFGCASNCNQRTSNHSVISSNNFHATNSDSYIRFASFSGMETDLINITGNLFIGGASDVALDLGEDCISGCGEIRAVLVDGNNFNMVGPDNVFGFSSVGTYDGIVIGTNVYRNDNSDCTGSATPFSCCTGSGTGTCIDGYTDDLAANRQPGVFGGATRGTWEAQNASLGTASNYYVNVSANVNVGNDAGTNATINKWAVPQDLTVTKLTCRISATFNSSGSGRTVAIEDNGTDDSICKIAFTDGATVQASVACAVPIAAGETVQIHWDETGVANARDVSCITEWSIP